jgi:FkbM family methyltransferase
MNVSGIPRASAWGRLLRLPLRWLPPDLAVWIVQGRLRGKRWIVGSSTHGCWLGSYEFDKQRWFAQTVQPGAVVFDLGGHVGYYTLLASELVGPAGRVITFEPLPRNLHYLRRHLALNKAGNVTVVEAAVSDRAGSALFDEGPSSFEGRVGAHGRLQVTTVALDELVRSGALPMPNVMKIDIEGAELDALQGARIVLSSARPTLFLSTHSSAVHQACCELLRSLGYALTPIDGQPLAMSRELLARPAAAPAPE